MMKYLLFCSLFFSLSFQAQSPYDVQHYQLGVRIVKGSSKVFIDESVTIQLSEPMARLELDLAGPLANGSGMKVISVTAPNQKLTWQQTLTSLQIDLPPTFKMARSPWVLNWKENQQMASLSALINLATPPSLPTTGPTVRIFGMPVTTTPQTKPPMLFL
jgi:hypothetical protein